MPATSARPSKLCRAKGGGSFPSHNVRAPEPIPRNFTSFANFDIETLFPFNRIAQVGRSQSPFGTGSDPRVRRYGKGAAIYTHASKALVHNGNIRNVKSITLDDVGTMSGEDLVRRYGTRALQQLVDLAVAAIKKGDDDEVRAIDGRLREVERVLSL